MKHSSLISHERRFVDFVRQPRQAKILKFYILKHLDSQKLKYK